MGGGRGEGKTPHSHKFVYIVVFTVYQINPIYYVSNTVHQLFIDAYMYVHMGTHPQPHP